MLRPEADEERRNRIAEAGRWRCMNREYLNELVIRQILYALPDGNSVRTEKAGLKTTTVI